MQSWDYAGLMLRVAQRLRDKDEIGDLPWEQRTHIYEQVDVLHHTPEWYRP